MWSKHSRSIEILPLLSRGKHLSPRQGACFMEFASYLAGERWSDHPACTHPLLASLARRVNDHIDDRRRQELLELVPEVIGLTSSDLHVDLAIALRAARTALPVVAEERQSVMAVAVLNCERLLADLEHRPGSPLSRQSRDALDSAPGAAAWAQRQYRHVRTSKRVFRHQTAPAIVACAVDSVAQACAPDPDRLLHDLLAGAVADCRLYCSPDATAPPTGRATAPVPPASLCSLGPPDAESVALRIDQMGELDRSVVDERDDHARA
ncbi:MAG: hypothetical protein ACRDWT_16520 [Jatrophihabitantaceae bacterium]